MKTAALVQLCGRTAAINDCEIVGNDFQKVKESLKVILEIYQEKVENHKEHFIAGYLQELSDREYEPKEEMAEAAFELLMSSMGNN